MIDWPALLEVTGYRTRKAMLRGLHKKCGTVAATARYIKENLPGSCTITSQSIAKFMREDGLGHMIRGPGGPNNCGPRHGTIKEFARTHKEQIANLTKKAACQYLGCSESYFKYLVSTLGLNYQDKLNRRPCFQRIKALGPEMFATRTCDEWALQIGCSRTAVYRAKRRLGWKTKVAPRGRGAKGRRFN